MKIGLQTPDNKMPIAEQVMMQFLVLKIIHLALVAGVVLFGVVVFILTLGRMTLTPAYQNPMSIIALVVCAAALWVSSVIRPFGIKPGAPSPEINAAFQKYQVFVIMRIAVIEGSALFSAVATIVSRNILPAILFAICVVALAIRRPSQAEFEALFPKRG